MTDYNYFLAVDLPTEIRSACLTYCLPQEVVQRTTPLYNLHITIGYIGPIKAELLEKITTQLQHLESCAPLTMKLDRLDCFGYGKNYKRYLGVVADDTSGSLLAIRDQAQEILQSLNTSFRGKRDFIPHITIQLLKKKGPNRDYQDQFKAQSLTPLTFTVNKVGLWYREPAEKRYYAHESYVLKG